MQMLFVPELERARFSDRQKKALWDRFFIGAPAQRRRPVERYSIVKRSVARRDGENPKTDAQVEEADLSCRSKDRAVAEVYCPSLQKKAVVVAFRRQTRLPTRRWPTASRQKLV